MHKSATRCNETIGKWCKNKHGASKIIDTFETYQSPLSFPSKICKNHERNGGGRPSYSKSTMEERETQKRAQPKEEEGVFIPPSKNMTIGAIYASFFRP
jgi:hypothetical protein